MLSRQSSRCRALVACPPRTTTALVCLAIFCFASRPTKSADDTPAATKERADQDDVLKVTASGWLSDSSCVSCHFKVPHQTGDFLQHIALARVLGKEQQCAACHESQQQPEGQCTRDGGCLRNAAEQRSVTYLGVTVDAVPPAVRTHVKLPANVGLIVQSVEDDSPAVKADLRMHDILVKLDQQLLINQEQFSVLIKMHPPAHEISLDLIRANQSKTVTAKLGERLAERTDLSAAESATQRGLAFLSQQQALYAAHVNYAAQLHQASFRRPTAETYLGVSVSSPPAALTEQLKLPAGLYLIVDQVEDGSPAVAAGLRPFDVLEKLDDQLLINSEQLTVLIRNHAVGDEVELTLLREGQPIKVQAKLGERKLARPETDAGAAVVDFDNDGRLDVYVTDNKGHFLELWNNTLADAVDLSIAGAQVSDDEFVRRTYLDLTGTPPSPKETADFVAQEEPNKRRLLVDRLLSRPEVLSKIGGSSVLQWSDSVHSLTLTTAETGQKRVQAKDKEGNVLFDGPVDTDAERQKLEPRLAAELQLMLKRVEGAESSAVAPVDVAAALETTLREFRADGETFKQLLDRLSRETGVNIVVDQQAVAAAGTAGDEPLTFELRNVRARSVLKAILALAGAGNGRLVHHVEDDVIFITVDRAEK